MFVFDVLTCMTTIRSNSRIFFQWSTGSQWSDTPKCLHMNTTSKLLAEPFGWVVARPRHPTLYHTKQITDVLSLSLHGVARTMVGGVVLYLWGCGWLPMLSGTMMGPVYAFGTWYLPPALQICPSFLTTNTCVQEFLWGMYVWMVLTLSLMVFRGSKRNHIIRNNVCSFVWSNVWIVGVETMLLASAVHYSAGEDGGRLGARSNTTNAGPPQGVFVLFGSGVLTGLLHAWYVYGWCRYRCSAEYSRTERSYEATLQLKHIHPFLINDDVLPPSCCATCVSRFLCFADNLHMKLVVYGSSPLLHEQTPFRLLLVVVSAVTMAWVGAMVVLLVWVQYT